MASSQSKASQNQLNTTNTAAANDQSTANSLYGQVQPILQAEATNPQGFSATDLNNMTTASNQTLGGGQAAAVGQAGLAANRTGNTGATSAVIDQAQRNSDQQQSANNLGIQNANAALKQTQQQEGIGGLSSLYGSNMGQESSLYGLGPGTLEAGKQPGWFQQLTGGLSALGQLGSGAGSAMTGYSKL
jgi:hypothetical protein